MTIRTEIPLVHHCIIVVRWQVPCKARIWESVLSYGRGYSPFFNGVWFACGHNRGHETEAARIPVPAGNDTKTLLNLSLRTTFSPPHKGPDLLPGSCVFKSR